MPHFSLKIKTYKALTAVWISTTGKFARMQQLPIWASNWDGGGKKALSSVITQKNKD
jgi:hypothetical protein